MPFVLDASVSVGWVIENQVTAYAEAVERALEIDQAFVPTLWWLEMTNALRTGCKRREMTLSEALEFIGVLAELPIRVEADQAKASDLLALALRYDLTAYDAAYLDLALRLRFPIATQDASLREASQASGVGLWAPP